MVDFSILISISQGSLSDIENDKTKPSFDTLANIFRRTDINIGWILTGDGPPYIKKEGDRRDEPADLVLIGQIIEHLEELLQEEGTNLPPAKKRRLIELLYKHFKKIGETADKSTTREYLRLVAA